MSQKKFKTDCLVQLARAEHRKDLPADPTIPSTLQAKLLKKPDKSKRAWLVKWTYDGKETLVSSTALGRALKPAAIAPAPVIALPHPLPVPIAPAPDVPIAGPVAAPVPAPIIDDDQDSLAENNDDEAQEPAEEDGDEEMQDAAPGVVTAHGYQWRDGPTVIADCRLIPAAVTYTANTTLLWNEIGIEALGADPTGPFSEANAKNLSTRQLLHYFLLAFPTSIVPAIVSRTNLSERMQTEKKMDNVAFFRFIGIVYQMTLAGLPGRRYYFEDQSARQTFIPKFNFGKGGMGIRQFEALCTNIEWSVGDPDAAFRKVDDIIAAFNVRRQRTVNPSGFLTVDESMSANRTNRTVKQNVPDGLPHQTKIARKPEGVGVEIRNCIDAKSEIMLALEIQEAKEVMASKKFAAGPGSAGMASILRLVEPWFGTGRTVYGDSAFASVRTAVELRKKGLYFMGLVKTASKGFPKKHLRDLTAFHQLRSGDSVYMVSDTVPHTLMAVSWWDKTQKTFVATCGSNAPAPPHERIRYRESRSKSERFTKSTPTSAVPFEYFAHAQKIDVANHRRQGILAIERTLTTHSWSLRLVSTVLGIILVDAYAMYRLDHPDHSDERVSFRDFTDLVSTDLITNALQIKEGVATRRRGANEIDSSSDGACSLAPLRKHAKYVDREMMRVQCHCIICHKKASFYCPAHSTEGKIATLCGPNTDSSAGTSRVRPCLEVHLAEATASKREAMSE